MESNQAKQLAILEFKSLLRAENKVRIINDRLSYYLRFVTNPADLQEYMKITAKMENE